MKALSDGVIHPFNATTEGRHESILGIPTNTRQILEMHAVLTQLAPGFRQPPPASSGRIESLFIAPLFVWGIFALLLLAAFAYVGRYGHNVPFWDEWLMVPYLTGHEPVTPAWLWSQHSEHRIPLARLIMLGLYKVTNDDFRAGMYFNVAAMGFLASVLIVAAQKFRGWTSYADAFFPLALLHWGHHENILWTWQVAFVVPVVLEGLLLACMVRAGARTPLAQGVAAGSCLAFLPLCGPIGLVCVPWLALWLGSVGAHHWRSPASLERRTGIVLLTLTALPLLIMGLYFIGYEEVAKSPSPGTRYAAKLAVTFLARSVGPIVESLGGASLRPSLARALPLGVFLLLLIGAARVLTVWQTQQSETTLSRGLLLFMAAMASLALAIGWGRAATIAAAGGFVPARYATLATPALCCTYFIWGVPRGWSVGRCVQWGLFLFMAVLLPFNTAKGLEYATWYDGGMSAFERDLKAGLPVSILVECHGSFLISWSPEQLNDLIPMLGDAKLGQFRNLSADLPGVPRLRHCSERSPSP